MTVERERDVYPHFIFEEIENNRWLCYYARERESPRLYVRDDIF